MHRMAPPPLWLLLQKTPSAIDHLERAHANMRVDLKTFANDKSATASANSVLCRAAHGKHVARGGLPAVDALRKFADEQHNVSSEGAEPAANVGAIGVAASSHTHDATSKHLGSAYLHLLNQKVHVFKKEQAPARPVSAQERQQLVEQTRQQWKAVKADANIYKDYNMANRVRKLRKLMPQPLLDSGKTAVGAWQPMWGASSSPACIVDPDTMQHLPQASCSSQAPLVWHDPSLLVDEDVEKILEGNTGDMDMMRAVHGCYNLKTNICRTHDASPDYNQQLEQLTKLMSKAVDELGKDNVEQVLGLLWLHDASHDDEAAGLHAATPSCAPKHDAIYVIGDARYKPNIAIPYTLPPQGNT